MLKVQVTIRISDRKYRAMAYVTGEFDFASRGLANLGDLLAPMASALAAAAAAEAEDWEEMNATENDNGE